MLASVGVTALSVRTSEIIFKDKWLFAAVFRNQNVRTGEQFIQMLTCG